MIDNQEDYYGRRRSNFDSGPSYQDSNDPWQAYGDIHGDFRQSQFRQSSETRMRKRPSRPRSNKNFTAIAIGIVAGTILLTEAQQYCFGDPGSNSAMTKYDFFRRSEQVPGPDDRTANIFKCMMGFIFVAACLKAYGRKKAVDRVNQSYEPADNIIGNASPMQVGAIMTAIVLCGFLTVSSYGSLVQEVKSTPTSGRRDFVNGVIGWSTWPPSIILCLAIMTVAFRQAVQKRTLIEETPVTRTPFKSLMVIAVSGVGMLAHQIKNKFLEQGPESKKIVETVSGPEIVPTYQYGHSAQHTKHLTIQTGQDQPSQVPFLLFYALIFFAFGSNFKWLHERASFLFKILSQIDVVCDKEKSDNDPESRWEALPIDENENKLETESKRENKPVISQENKLNGEEGQENKVLESKEQVTKLLNYELPASTEFEEKIRQKSHPTNKSERSGKSRAKSSVCGDDMKKIPLRGEIQQPDETAKDEISESCGSSVAATKEIFENVTKKGMVPNGVGPKVDDVAVEEITVADISNNLEILEDFEKAEKIVKASESSAKSLNLVFNGRSRVIQTQESLENEMGTENQTMKQQQSRQEVKKTRIPVRQRESSRTSLLDTSPKKFTGLK